MDWLLSRIFLDHLQTALYARQEHDENSTKADLKSPPRCDSISTSEGEGCLSILVQFVTQGHTRYLCTPETRDVRYFLIYFQFFQVAIPLIASSSRLPRPLTNSAAASKSLALRDLGFGRSVHWKEKQWKHRKFLRHCCSVIIWY